MWQLCCYLVEFSVFNLITHAEKSKRRGPDHAVHSPLWTTLAVNILGGSLFFQRIELNIKTSTKQQQSCRFVGFFVFNSSGKTVTN